MAKNIKLPTWQVLSHDFIDTHSFHPHLLLLLSSSFNNCTVPWIHCSALYFCRYSHDHSSLNSSQLPLEFDRWNNMFLHIRKHAERCSVTHSGWHSLGQYSKCLDQYKRVISTFYPFKDTDVRKWTLFSVIIQPLGIISSLSNKGLTNRAKDSCVLWRLGTLVF